jgi:hypothetical protein
METDTPQHDPKFAPDWTARRQYWQRKLGRLRLGAEPIEVQLARYRRVTWMLTAVPLGLALMFVGLFAAFKRPDVGLTLVGILLLPIVVLAWLDYAVLAARAARYSRELREAKEPRSTPGRT